MYMASPCLTMRCIMILRSKKARSTIHGTLSGQEDMMLLHMLGLNRQIQAAPDPIESK